MKSYLAAVNDLRLPDLEASAQAEEFIDLAVRQQSS